MVGYNTTAGNLSALEAAFPVSAEEKQLRGLVVQAQRQLRHLQRQRERKLAQAQQAHQAEQQAQRAP